MGHTLSSQRMMVDQTIKELADYAKALRPDDRKVCTDILKLPLKKVGAISYASSLHVWAFCLLSIIVEQEKRIRTLEDVVYRRVSEREQDNSMG